MSRNSSWTNSCPERVAKRISACARAGLSIQQLNDPTKFSVKDRQGKKFRCAIGSLHSCMCSSAQPCLHVLFVLISLYKVERTNPVLWQKGVSELELSNWIERRLEIARCVFCHECVAEGHGCDTCKAQFHERCFKLACAARGCEATVCPRCSTTVVVKTRRNKVICDSCHRECHDVNYQCLLCVEFILCSSCYRARNVHAEHPFSHKNGTAYHPSEATVNPASVGELQYRDINPEDYETLAALDSTRRKHLSSHELSRLALVEYSSSGSINQCCPVCQQNYLRRDVCILLACGHTMHQQCGLDWLSKYSDECPIDHAQVRGQMHEDSALSLAAYGRGGGEADRLTRVKQRRAIPPLFLPPIAAEKKTT